MSWSVTASGKPVDVKRILDEQFLYPLHNLEDEGEKETVRRTQRTIGQVIDTFDPDVEVSVTAHGHMSFTGPSGVRASVSQTVQLNIAPL
jgi:hypothetical protein